MCPASLFRGRLQAVTRANERVEGNHIRCALYSTYSNCPCLPTSQHPAGGLSCSGCQDTYYYGVSTQDVVVREDKEQTVLVRNPLSVLFETWIVFPSPSLYLSLIFQQESPSTSEDILGGPTMISGAKTFKFRGGGGRERRPSPPQGNFRFRPLMEERRRREH